MSYFFFFNDTATTEIYTLSLHDALPILEMANVYLQQVLVAYPRPVATLLRYDGTEFPGGNICNKIRIPYTKHSHRSEEHTSELQSRQYLVCRLLLEKKK